MKKEVALKRYKKDMEHSYSLGAAPTIELLKNVPECVIKVIISNRLDKDSNIDIIFDICEKWNIPIETNEKAINRISKKGNCFVIGVFEKFTKKVENDSSHVILVNPSNMGNLGTIIRTCVGFGINNLVLITPCVDIFDPKVVRASMGALFRLNFSHYDSFSEYLREYGDRAIYTFMLKGATDLNKLERDKNEKFSLIFGNEATGLDDSFLEVGKSVLIRHSDAIDSLNLPIAVGIAVHQFVNSN
jgi:TrmH family RNA methyltransferase